MGTRCSIGRTANFLRMKSPERTLKGSPTEPATIDGATLKLLPTPHRRKPQLTSFDGVRCEMARIYREAESGKRDSAEASKLVYILGQIGRVLEVVEIEARLRALEAITDGKQLPAPR